MKGNHIPIGLIPVENLFEKNDVAKNLKMKPIDDVVEDKNIGTEGSPKIIKLSKSLSSKEKEDYNKFVEKVH